MIFQLILQISWLVPYGDMCMLGFAAGICAELYSLGQISLISTRFTEKVLISTQLSVISFL